MMRRVLMTADAVGGVWTHALDLAHGLAARGFAVTLAVLGPAPSPAQREAAAVPLLETGLPLDWMVEGPEPVLAAGRRIADLAREHGADLLHLNSPALAAAGGFAMPVLGACHSCLATWWQAVRGGPLPEGFAWHAALLRQAYRRVDRLVAPSRAFATATRAAYALPRMPDVVPNGRAPQPLDAPAGQYAFTAGRLWDEGKDIATLDRAAARLDLPFLAAGPLRGPNGAGIAVRHLQPLGALDPSSVAQHLAARPVFVSAARYEPFGLAVLEAAQAGCALVLSDISSFREIWGDAALFVPARDDRGFADAIAALSRDGALRQRLGMAAQAQAGRYTVAAMVDGMLDLYDALLPMEAGA